MQGKRHVYIAIMVAAAKGKGLHLTAEEVVDLSLDAGIETCANIGTARMLGISLPDDCVQHCPSGPADVTWDWKKIKP